MTMLFSCVRTCTSRSCALLIIYLLPWPEDRSGQAFVACTYIPTYIHTLSVVDACLSHNGPYFRVFDRNSFIHSFIHSLLPSFSLSLALAWQRPTCYYGYHPSYWAFVVSTTTYRKGQNRPDNIEISTPTPTESMRPCDGCFFHEPRQQSRHRRPFNEYAFQTLNGHDSSFYFIIYVIKQRTYHVENIYK